MPCLGQAYDQNFGGSNTVGAALVNSAGKLPVFFPGPLQLPSVVSIRARRRTSRRAVGCDLSGMTSPLYPGTALNHPSGLPGESGQLTDQEIGL
jgi:hypothetical protein